MLDVAGLIPGASEGLGLGNKFLDDLRHADVLIHVVDVSGTTNAKGETTTGYDPSNDIDWLRSEIHNWVYHNLHKKWDQVARRHIATRATIVETLQLQLSGYGASHRIILDLVTALGPSYKPLDQWDKDIDLKHVVDTFLNVRFPTIVALNKIDVADADKNITKMARKYDESMLVYVSALAEAFLRKMAKSGFIRYYEGTDRFEMAHEEEPPLEPALKPVDEKMAQRLEKIRGAYFVI